MANLWAFLVSRDRERYILSKRKTVHDKGKDWKGEREGDERQTGRDDGSRLASCEQDWKPERRQGDGRRKRPGRKTTPDK